MRDTEKKPMAPLAVAEGELKDLGRRIDVLAAAKTQETPLRTQRRVAEVRELDASARAAAHDAAGSSEETLLELDLRVKLAERAAAVELAEDEDEFVGALMKELRSWDVYLERLQVKVATTAGDGRNQGEAAIRELRRRRNTLSAHLGEMTSISGTAWRRVREHVKVTRNELKSGAAELEVRFAGGTEK